MWIGIGEPLNQQVGSPGTNGASTTITVPSGFTYTTYPFNIKRTWNGGITHDFDITTIIPAITNTWYVDPVSGNDGTAVVNDRTHPLLNLATALAKNPCDQVRIINLTSNFLGRTTKSWNNVQPAVSMSVVVEGNFRYISGKFASATVPTWIVNGSFANVYQTTIASASAAKVIDTSIQAFVPYSDKNNATQLADLAAPIYSSYTNVGSAAAVSALAGSWFHDGTNLHVRALDDRSLIGDAALVLSTTGNNGRYGAVTNNLTLYVQGIDFVGGNAPFLALTALTGNTGTIAFNKCSFQGAQTASNGLSIQGKLTVYGYRNGAYYNQADGFNYHSFEADGVTTGSSPTFVEIDCVSVGNGTTGSAGTSDNASTCHDFVNGIRINGIYVNSDDRVLAETNSAQTWNLGCYVGQAIQTAAGRESIAALLTSHVWIDSVYTKGGANPQWIAAQSSTLNYFKSGNVVNAGTGEATGTVAVYVP